MTLEAMLARLQLTSSRPCTQSWLDPGHAGLWAQRSTQGSLGRCCRAGELQAHKLATGVTGAYRLLRFWKASWLPQEAARGPLSRVLVRVLHAAGVSPHTAHQPESCVS